MGDRLGIPSVVSFFLIYSSRYFFLASSMTSAGIYDEFLEQLLHVYAQLFLCRQ